MTYLNPIKCGLILGVLIGIGHMAWALMVALGWGQPVMDFLLTVHFLAPTLHVREFDLLTATTLVAFTSVIAFILGYGLAVAMNGGLEREP